MKLRPDAIRLLRRVKRHILAEPKRYDQTQFIDRPERGAPACGTVGCVAGWTVLLSIEKEKRDALSKRLLYSEYQNVEGRAKRILHLSFDQASELFDGGALPRGHGRVGTKKYALAGAEHIEKFIKDNS